MHFASQTPFVLGRKRTSFLSLGILPLTATRQGRPLRFVFPVEDSALEAAMYQPISKLLFYAALAIWLALIPAFTWAEELCSGPKPSGEEMLLDVAVVRPLGIVATALGTATFLVSLPFSAAGGNVGEAAQQLVVKPAKFTFSRPLGQIHRCDNVAQGRY